MLGPQQPQSREEMGLLMLTRRRLVSKGEEDEKPRPAPPPPTIVKFPNHHPVRPVDPLIGAELTFEELQEQFRIKPNVKEFSAIHTSTLALEVVRETSLLQLVPPEYLPGLCWDEQPLQSEDGDASASRLSSPSSETLSNGAAVPSHEAYFLRKKEIVADNDDAYASINKMRPSIDRNALRLTHFRNFFIQLREMGKYWDTSHDKFVPASERSPSPVPPETNGLSSLQIPGFGMPNGLRKVPSNQSETKTSSLEAIGEVETPDGRESAPLAVHNGPYFPDHQQNSGGPQNRPRKISDATKAHVPTIKEPPAAASAGYPFHIPPANGNGSSNQPPKTPFTPLTPLISPSIMASLPASLLSKFDPQAIMAAHTPATAPGAPPDTLYTGRRTSTGSKMPDHVRKDVVRAFLEPIAWAFACRLENPRHQPLFKLGNRKIKIEHHGMIYRTPTDRQKNRAGLLEGPLIAVSTRSGIEFGGASKGRDVMDLLQEVALGALLGQERSREGLEQNLYRDTWWASGRRYGGGSGIAIGKPLEHDDDEGHRPAKEHNKDHDAMDVDGEEVNGAHQRPAVAVSTTPKPGSEDDAESVAMRIMRSAGAKTANPSCRKSGNCSTHNEARRKALQEQAQADARRQKLLEMSWRVPQGTWDKRVTYSQIGKDRSQECDNLFIISALNHHISIVRFFIQPGMLRYLARGDVKADPAWWGIKMQRSRWYDLLSPQDRLEAMRGIWAVLGWLMRDTKESMDTTG